MREDFGKALRKLGLKVTPRRLALLQTLAESAIYLSPEEVWACLRAKFPDLGLPTVYRNLEELAEGDILSKVLRPDRKLYYYLCRNRRHHHHFVCLSCRKVEDIDGCALDAVSQEIGRNLHARVISHTFQVEGLCETCSSRKGAKES